jgi:oxygen-dependent protoporphyrinogen oxidase
LVEAGPNLGGKVRTESTEGYVIEHGPDSFVSYRPEATRLAGEVGLADEIIGLSSRRSVYLRVNGQLRPLPAGMGLVLPSRLGPFITTRILNWPDKLRAGLDLVLPRQLGSGDISIGDFLAARLGPGIVAKFAEPMVGGIYGASVSQLSLDAVLPQLRANEWQHRSLLLASLAEGRAKAKASPDSAAAGSPVGRRHTQDRPPGRASANPVSLGGVPGGGRSPNPTSLESAAPIGLFRTLRPGLGSLVDALSATLQEAGVEIILNTAVTPEDLSAPDVDAVILAGGVTASADLLDPFAPAAAAALRTIPLSSSTIVTLAYPADAFPRALGTHGWLEAGAAPVSGITVSSAKWEGRAPAGQVLIRAFVPARLGSLCHAPDAELLAAVTAHLGTVLGVTALPDFVRLTRWAGVMPSYTVGHLDRVRAVEEALVDTPWRVAGSALHGVGLPDCVRDGRRAAADLLDRASQGVESRRPTSATRTTEYGGSPHTVLAANAMAAPSSVSPRGAGGSPHTAVERTPQPGASPPYDALILLGFGGPESLDEVVPFLERVTAGRGIPPERLIEVGQHYVTLGGISPINEQNRALRTALAERLTARGLAVEVALANRNSAAFVPDVLRDLAARGQHRVLGLATAAFASYSGCRQYREDLGLALTTLGQAAAGLQVAKIPPYADLPGLVTANIDLLTATLGQGTVPLSRCSEPSSPSTPATSTSDRPAGAAVPNLEPADAQLAGAPGSETETGDRHHGVRNPLNGQGSGGQNPVTQSSCAQSQDPPGYPQSSSHGSLRVLFTTHSIPTTLAASAGPPDVPTDAGLYVAQHMTLARRVIEGTTHQLGLATPPDWALVYQSRSGSPHVPWLEPDINDAIRQAAAAGVRDIVIVPIGFLTDHVEVIWDLDTQARQTAEAVGLRTHRVPTVGTHPAFLDSLADLAATYLSSPGRPPAAGEPCFGDCCHNPRSQRPVAPGVTLS